jgi:metal-responsive CopG/Arc/MetJ family transcriptional regulator
MTVPQDLLRAVDEVAKAEGRTRSSLIREAVRRYVDKRLAAKKQNSRLLSRLAASATQGPRLDATDLDRVLYAKRQV